MLRINDILDTLENLMKERFPDSEGHRNLVYKDFKRSAFLVEVEKLTMETATRGTLDRTAQAVISLFEPVDIRHNTQVEVLADRLTLALELFSCAAIPVKDRYLDVSNLSGDYFNDYAELTFTLSWQDDRETGPVESALAQYYDLEIKVNQKEERYNG